MSTAPGVFCPDRLDSGTSVLLRHVPEPPETGDFLDIGCGWGPIATTLALLRPQARIWAVDVNERALNLCANNAENNGASNVSARRPSEVSPDIRFDVIWSNPPIRVGKKVLHDMLLAWLPRLKVGAHAYLVVQKNLGSDSLATWLTQNLTDAYAVNRLTSVKGFRILDIERLTDGGPSPIAAGDGVDADAARING